MIRLYTQKDSGEFYRKIDLPTLRQVRNARTYAVKTENGALLVEFHWLDDGNVTAYADDKVCCLMTNSSTVAMRCATIDNPNGIQELFDFFISLTSTDIYEMERLEDRLDDLEDRLFTNGKPNDSGLNQILKVRRDILQKKRYYEQMEILSDELADLDHTFDFIDKNSTASTSLSCTPRSTWNRSARRISPRSTSNRTRSTSSRTKSCEC